jgi:nitronate monooxygenase
LQPFDEARCRIVEQHAPAVVSFHFGLPSPDLVARVKATGAKLVSSATTVAEALYLESRGCDAVIAQGLEAGGHRGMFLTDDVLSQTGTMALVPQIVDAVDLPVIATGGIADGRGIVAALALGASAVQLGTAFLHAEETTISEAYKAGLRQAGDRQTAVTNVYSGRPTRCLTNRMMLEKGPLTGAAPAFPKGFAITGPLRQQAEAQGSSDFSAHYCGQSAALGKPTTAGQLVRDIAHDARQQMNRFT